MPAIAHSITRGTAGTTTSGTFVDAQCTGDVLDSAVDYLVLGLANCRSIEGGGDFVEIEGRFGGTRLGVTRLRHPFETSNTGDSAQGAYLCVAAVVTGNGSDALNMRARNESGTTPTVRYGAQSWLAISLAELVENTDYWVDQAANSDTAEFTSAQDDLYGARLLLDSTVIGPERHWSAGEPFNGSADFGPTFLAIDVRTLTASVEYTLGWEYVDTQSAGTPSTWGASDAQLTFTPDETGDYLIIASCEASGTGSAVDYRRSRIFVLRLNALENADYIVDAGNINAGEGTTEGANALTVDFGSAVDAVVLGSGTFRYSGNFAETFLRRQGSPDVDTPDPDGHSYVWDIDASLTVQSMHHADAVEITGSTSWNLVAQTGAAGAVQYGRDFANSASSRAVLVALQMDTVEGFGELAGTSVGNATASGTLSATGDLAGSSAGSATASGTLTATAALAGTSVGSSQAIGTLTATGDLAGQSDGSSTATGTLTTDGALAGQADGTSTATGTLTGVGALAGVSAGLATAAATLLAIGTLAGVAAGGATVSGTLTAIGELAGASSGTSTATGALSGELGGQMSGVSIGTSTAVGTLTAYGDMAGISAGTSTATLANDLGGTSDLGIAVLTTVEFACAVQTDSEFACAVET